MASDFFQYDANEVKVVWNGVTLFGFGDADMVKGSRDANKIEPKVDAQGQGSIAKVNNSLGTVTVSLSSLSPCYPQLIKDAKAGTVAPLFVHHKDEYFGGTKAVIEKDPEASFGKDVGTRDFSFKVLDFDHDFNS